MKPPWTDSAKLPGGDMPGAEFESFYAGFKARYRFLAQPLARRIARAYGTRADQFLGKARSLSDLGEDFGGGITAAEVDYLYAREWARSAEDILWRRSKLGLHVPTGTAERIDAYLMNKKAAAIAAQ